LPIERVAATVRRMTAIPEIQCDVAVIGAGPAGLMAAEALAGGGHGVVIFDAMATPGRKFLMAGRGGLNLTHSEALPVLAARYGTQARLFSAYLNRFSPADLRRWADGLGADTFIGSSGRVFPRALKASGLLRRWLGRLTEAGVAFRLRHRWLGFKGGGLLFRDHAGEQIVVRPRATLLALGGASWPKLGSDAAWAPILAAAGIDVRPLRPSNCGFDVAWSGHFQARAAGQPMKNIALRFGDRVARGEIMLTAQGIEGGAVYALSGPIREALGQANVPVELHLDLKPDLDDASLAQRLAARRSGRSLSRFFAKDLHLSPLAYPLLREVVAEIPDDPVKLAGLLKRMPLRVLRTRPIAEAISTAGGISFDAVDEHLMLRKLPGVFVAGEMLDWEAPTGGYLLQGCMSTAKAAADGMANWLDKQSATSR
jgi:uncharacterized flavoprotein (TIGR03862 family)